MFYWMTEDLCSFVLYQWLYQVKAAMVMEEMRSFGNQLPPGSLGHRFKESSQEGPLEAERSSFKGLACQAISMTCGMRSSRFSPSPYPSTRAITGKFSLIPCCSQWSIFSCWFPWFYCSTCWLHSWTRPTSTSTRRDLHFWKWEPCKIWKEIGWSVNWMGSSFKVTLGPELAVIHTNILAGLPYTQSYQLVEHAIGKIWSLNTQIGRRMEQPWALAFVLPFLVLKPKMPLRGVYTAGAPPGERTFLALLD